MNEKKKYEKQIEKINDGTCGCGCVDVGYLEEIAQTEGARKERKRWSKNMQDLWAALKMIRDYVEHQVVGAMKAEEHINPPHPENEAKEIIKGIEKIIQKNLQKRNLV